MVKQGDIFYVQFNPSVGHEQQKMRPALALSNDMITKTSGMTIVAPISSTQRSYPAYYHLETTKIIHGKVLLDQTIALDLKARSVTDKDIKEHLSRDELIKVINRYKLLFDIN